MNLTAGFLRRSFAPLLLSAVLFGSTNPGSAQTAHHSTHHTTARHRKAKAKAKTNACTGDPLPQMSALIPAIPGCPSTLFALRYVDTVTGTGAPAASRKFLTVNYTGYLADGTKFDTSIGKQPITFPYGAHQVITGWDTGFQGMLVGGKRRLYIPYQLAYGEAGRPPVIPAKALLIFDVELLAVSETPPPPQAPAAQPAPQPAPQPGGRVLGQQTSTQSSGATTTSPTRPSGNPPSSNPPKP